MPARMQARRSSTPFGPYSASTPVTPCRCRNARTRASSLPLAAGSVNRRHSLRRLFVIRSARCRGRGWGEISESTGQPNCAAPPSSRQISTVRPGAILVTCARMKVSEGLSKVLAAMASINVFYSARLKSLKCAKLVSLGSDSSVIGKGCGHSASSENSGALFATQVLYARCRTCRLLVLAS